MVAGLREREMRRYCTVIVSVFLLGLAAVNSVWAHAVLLRTDPAPNSILAEPPAEIRLWFSEPLEPTFSSIRLLDVNGNTVEQAASEVDPNDPYQMALRPGDLPDGLYTIVWQALSAADGHPTQGSFVLTIGAAVAGSAGDGTGSEVVATIPTDRAIIRWANLLSLALAVGSIGFRLFVWDPGVGEAHPDIERRMDRLTYIGWALAGVAGVLVLFMQLSTALGQPLFAGVTSDVLGRVIADTRFGHIWLVRMALWLGLGGALLFARDDRWFSGVAFLLGLAVLGTNSLFSHASSGADALPSVAADYLHLAATALWVGGLIMFVSVIGPVRRAFPAPAVTLGHLVANFTNFARASVAILIITGLYAAWLQVGSIEGLVTTPYGQALLVKLLLILPLFAVGAINMLLTHRGLEAGKDVWAGRLRNLVGTEIALTLGVLAAVGVMTSISPARTTLNTRALAASEPPDNTTVMAQEADDLNVQLEITPGWIGENTFTLTITGEDGSPVTDASLIRMRFTAPGIGESELRPANVGSGVYTVAGLNLSVPGEWRIRTIIQRPGEFDTLVDFEPIMEVAPAAPPPTPARNVNAPLPNRVPALLLTGVLCMAAGGFFLAENRHDLKRGAALLGGGLTVVACVFLATGAQALQTPTVAAAQETSSQAAGNDPVRMGFSPVTALPYLVTAGGELLQPDDNGIWRPLPLDAQVNDLYIDTGNTIWAATDAGLRAYRDGAWQAVNDLAARRLEQSHGYLFALGEQVARVPLAAGSLEPWRRLNKPLADQAASDFVMLGNHSHVLQNGDQVFASNDLGLSWESLNAPQPVHNLWLDAGGNLLACSDGGILSWNYASRTWAEALPLPDGQQVDVLRNLNDKLFALADGRLYRLAGRTWTPVNLPDANVNALAAIGTQYPGTFWVLDGTGRRLWSTTDGSNWTLVPIQIGGSTA
jgi:copper transport protein